MHKLPLHEEYEATLVRQTYLLLHDLTMLSASSSLTLFCSSYHSHLTRSNPASLAPAQAETVHIHKLPLHGEYEATPG